MNKIKLLVTFLSVVLIASSCEQTEKSESTQVNEQLNPDKKDTFDVVVMTMNCDVAPRVTMSGNKRYNTPSAYHLVLIEKIRDSSCAEMELPKKMYYNCQPNDTLTLETGYPTGNKVYIKRITNHRNQAEMQLSRELPEFFRIRP